LDPRVKKKYAAAATMMTTMEIVRMYGLMVYGGPEKDVSE